MSVPADELARLLRPAGGGIYTVSTGKAEQLAVQRRIYGVQDEAQIAARWRESIARLTTATAAARVALLGVPSDVGAGFRRGANLGPQALRQAWLARRPDLRLGGEDGPLVDVGDVFVVPQLLHDEMVSPEQLWRSREALYGSAPDAAALPVSPLSIAEAAVRLLMRCAPGVRPLVLGGDHSVSWPVLRALLPGPAARDVGILHFDAHTDLLADRLGIRYCFATWAYHANELLGRGGRLVQVGIRASGKGRAHWEGALGVRQYWMDEVRARGIDAVAAEIVAHLRDRGVRALYISNDIDGTDAAWAGATGTPETGGLHPDEVCQLIREVGAAFTPLGADLVEVAPPLGHGPGEPERTLSTGARYLEETLAFLAR